MSGTERSCSLHWLINTAREYNTLCNARIFSFQHILWPFIVIRSSSLFDAFTIVKRELNFQLLFNTLDSFEGDCIHKTLALEVSKMIFFFMALRVTDLSNHNYFKMQTWHERFPMPSPNSYNKSKVSLVHYKQSSLPLTACYTSDSLIFTSPRGWCILFGLVWA